MIKMEFSPKVYVKKDDFIRELKLSQKSGTPTDELVKILMNIAFRFSSRYNFWQYTYREDMIMEGVERMLTKVDKFDCNRGSSPLAYFTQICYNQFLQCIQKEKKQHIIRELVSEEKWDAHCQDFDLHNAYANLPEDSTE